MTATPSSRNVTTAADLARQTIARHRSDLIGLAVTWTDADGNVADLPRVVCTIAEALETVDRCEDNARDGKAWYILSPVTRRDRQTRDQRIAATRRAA